MKVYAISGLGADRRVFSALNLDCDLEHIEWIAPLNLNERLEDYALRLSENIDFSEGVIVLAVSFGGLIATELNARKKIDSLILISSCDTHKGINPFFRYLKFLIPLLPKRLLKPPLTLACWAFGTKQRSLLKTILNDSNLDFNKWAIYKLLNWTRERGAKNVLKINGANDKLIRPESDRNTVLIERGEHFMIVDRADEVSAIINRELNNYFSTPD